MAETARRHSFSDDIKRIGFTGWSSYVLDRALAKISGQRVRLSALWFYAQPVQSIPKIDHRATDRIQVKVAERDEVPDGSFGRPPGAIAERFEQGSVCIAATKDGELAGFMWLQFDALRERLLRCDFVPSPHGTVSWDFDLYVAPQYRLGRTFGRLWSRAKEILVERGVQTTVSWIAFDNASSQRAHERMGARRVGWALILTAWALQVTLSSCHPYFGVTWRKKDRTRLLVRAG